jgi:broad specificity phosphatase PhoE
VRVTLVRHAESLGNAGLDDGPDAGLSSKGREQARRAAARLAREGVTHVWASPYRRAIDTALAIARSSGLGVVVDPRMGEHFIYENAHRWRAPSGRAIRRQYRGQGLRLASDFPAGRWTPAWGEPWEALCARTALVAKRALALDRRRAGRNTHLVVVGHGASVKTLLRALTGIEIPQEIVLLNASFSRVHLARALPGRLVFLNDVRHLRGL